MKKIEIANSYNNTKEVVFGISLEDVQSDYISGLEVKAEWLAENEVEEDWENYYPTYEHAFNATYEMILKQLINEVNFQEIKKGGN